MTESALACVAPGPLDLLPMSSDAQSGTSVTAPAPNYTSANPMYLSPGSPLADAPYGSMMSVNPAFVYPQAVATAPTLGSRTRRAAAMRRGEPHPANDAGPGRPTVKDSSTKPKNGQADSAVGTTPGGRSAKRDGTKKPVLGGGSAHPAHSVANDQARQDEAIEIRLALPSPRPAQGSAEVRRGPLYLAIAGRSFAAPTSLSVKSATPAKQAAAEQKATNPLATDPGLARASYAEAAQAGQNLYDRLIRAAQALAADAHGVNMALSDLQQRDLDGQLGQLAETLTARTRQADAERDFALNHVRSRADLMRAKVRSHAGGAIGRLTKLSGTFSAKLGPLRAGCATALGTLQTAYADASAASLDAHAELQALARDPRSYLSQVDPFNAGTAVAEAELEAAVHYVGPRVTADDDALARRLDVVEGFLKPMLACLPCEIDGKFQALETHAANLSSVGPKAVRAARDAALESISNTQHQLELGIADIHRQTETTATEQHDAARVGLIAQTKAAGASDRADLAQTAKRQIDMVMGIAAAQPASLTRVHDELRRASELPPAQFAPAAVRAARRLKANIEATGERHPGQVLQAAELQAKARQRRVAQGDSERATTLAQFDRSLGAMVDGNFRRLALSNDAVLFGLDPVPAQVGHTCDGFISSAQQALDTSFATLATDAAFLVTRMTDALDGLIPPAPGATGGTGGTTGTNSSLPPGSVFASQPNTSSMSVAPPMMSVAPVVAPTPPAAAGAPRRVSENPPPRPASCEACDAAQTPATGGATSGSNASTAPGGSSGTSASGGTPASGGPTTSGPGNDAGVSSGATDVRSPRSYRTYADGITLDVLSAPQVNAFKGLVASNMNSRLAQKANAAHTAIEAWGETDMTALMGALRGLTQKQGRALIEVYGETLHFGNLRQQIIDHAHDSVVTDESTDNYNMAGALAALDGDVDGAAINELRAGFNFSNSTERIMTVMRSMSSDQMASFIQNHHYELESLITQLDDSEAAQFRQLMTGDMTGLRAQQIKTGLDDITRNYYSGGNTPAARNERRGDQTGDLLGAAHSGTGAFGAVGLEGPADRVDVFGLEDPTVASARGVEHWTRVQQAFGTLPGVVDAIAATSPAAAVSRPTDTAGSSLIAYATRPIQMYPWKDGQYGTRSPYAQQQGTSGTSGGSQQAQSPYPPQVSEVDQYHRLLIENIVNLGSDSREARAARALVEIRRVGGQPTQDGLEAALHMGSADAREGGHFAHGSTHEAEEERGQIFRLAEQYRRNLEGGATGEITVAGAQASFRSQVEYAFRNDPARQAMALGTVDHEEGNVQAVVNFAIQHEDTALLTRYLQRMDSRQIGDMISTWNAAHPGGPGLEEKLGVNGHHWSIGNMNGAVFTGDEANTLEIAFMGVPQNDLQRGEVALRIMNQQIEQSTWLGQLLAGDEYKRLTDNATALKAQMGATDAQIDSRGRIQFIAADGHTPIHLNFNASGDFVPAPGAHGNAFEQAVALAQITSTNFTEAVDRIGTIVATALIVIAAVITTAVTFGGAAAIWGPMLITFGAGALGIGFKAALKGGRYGRDELTNDIVATLVQTATAGMGAALGAAAKTTGSVGRLAALRTLAEKIGVPLKGPVASLWQGAAFGAMSSAATTAFDPAARRSDNYSDMVLHSFLRGGAGGLATAGISHVVSSGLSGAAQRLGAVRAARLALERGASREAAIRYAAMGARNFANNRIVTTAIRALASGTGGSASRGVEMGYENIFAGGHHRAGDFASEMRGAFLQNALQGGLEQIAEYHAQSRSPVRREEHEAQIRQSEHEYQAAARQAVDTESQRRAPANSDGAPLARSSGPSRLAEPESLKSTAVREPPAAANDNLPPAPLRVAVGGEPAEGPIHPARLAPEEPAPRATPPEPTLAEEHASGLVHPDPNRIVEPAHETVRVRSIGAPEEPAMTVRSDPDEITGRHSLEKILQDGEIAKAEIAAREARKNEPRSMSEHIAANDRELRPIHDRVDLTYEHMVEIGAMPIGSRITATDPGDPVAARHNYDMMRTRNPEFESLLVHNPQTGEYMVVQGGPFSAEKPGPEWIVERHSHPRLVSEELNAQLVRSMPSATDGDFAVLKSEVDRQARGLPEGTVTTRRSTIDIEVNGIRSETTFSITRGGTGDYELSVSFRHPQNGETTLGPFTNIAAYEAHALKLTGVDFSNPGAETVRSIRAPGVDPPPGPPRAVRGEVLTPEQRRDVHFAGERLAMGARFREEAAGTRPRGTFDPRIAEAATTLDAHAAVKRLGLVGETDSMIRLHTIINDPAIPPEMKSAVSRAVLDATRDDMVRAGTLKPGDELMMLFQGAPAAQSASYDRIGMDMAEVKGRASDDAGRGLYGSQDYQSAALYTEGSGQVFPMMVRRSELGNVIDVRPGTPLGDRWAEFVRSSQGHPDALSFGKIVPVGGRPYLQTDSLYPHPTMTFGPEGAGRGLRYEAFLARIAADPSLPPELRAAAADPHITLMDLGGIASWGTDRGMITDQLAIHNQRIADLFNEQMGFPKPGSRIQTEDAGPGTVRSVGVTNGQASATAASQVLRDRFARALDLSIAHLPPETQTELRQNLARLGYLDRDRIIRYFNEPRSDVRRTLHNDMAAEMLGNQMKANTENWVHISGTMRDLIALDAQIGPRLREISQHLARTADPNYVAPPVSARMVRAVGESPFLAHFADTQPTLFAELETRYFKRNSNRDQSAASVERFMVASLNGRTRGKDAARVAVATGLLEDARILRPDVIDRNTALTSAIHTVDREVIARPTLEAGASVVDASSQFSGRVPVTDSTQVTPGMMIDHVDHGRGTVVRLSGDSVEIHFDSQSPDATPMTIVLTDNRSFPARNAQATTDLPVTPIRDASEVQSAQQQIDKIRIAEQFGPFVNASEAGTVSIARAGAVEAVGTNSTLTARSVTLTPADRAELLTLMVKMGLDPHNSTNDPQFVHHAELASLFNLRASLREQGSPFPPVVELFVDRNTCNSCKRNLDLVAAYLGIAELRVYPRNQPLLIRKARHK